MKITHQEARQLVREIVGFLDMADVDLSGLKQQDYDCLEDLLRSKDGKAWNGYQQEWEDTT